MTGESSPMIDANCYLCKIKFDSDNKLDRHIKTIHLRMFVCPRCPDFSSLIKVCVTQHLKKFHNATDTTDSITILDDAHMEKDTSNAGPRNRISSQARKSLNDVKRTSPTLGIETYPNAEKNLSSISEQIARQNVELRTDTNAEGNIYATLEEIPIVNGEEVDGEGNVQVSEINDSFFSENLLQQATVENSIVDEMTLPKNFSSATPVTALRPSTNPSQSLLTRPGPSSKTGRKGLSHSTSLSRIIEDSIILTEQNSIGKQIFECDHCWFTTERKTDFEIHEKFSHALVF